MISKIINKNIYKMKAKLHSFMILTCLLVLGMTKGFTQQKNVGIGTSKPDNSAVLDIQSTEKGLLIPRLSLEQRNSIASPASGLLIYQMDTNSGFYFYNGSKWKPLSENDARSIAIANPDNWSITGNTSTNPSSNFIGTTDNSDLVFKANGQKGGTIDINGTTLFGYASGFNYNTVSATFDENSAFGAYTLFNNSRGAGDLGSKNTAVGYDAMRTNTTGYYNVAIGRYALRGNTTGHHNVALGGDVLGSNTSGNFNMGIGWGSLFFNTSGSNNLAIGANALNSTTGNDNTAIGTEAGQLATGSSNVFIGNQSGKSETGSGKLYISNSNTATPLVYGDFSAKYVTIGEVTPALRTQGTATGGYNLLVKGGILTEKVKVALAAAGTDWADYVFEPEYKSNMMSLEEVEKFTLKNKHLPNVPSAEEMVKTGLDVSQTSKMFMEKIEELTLYMIELNKEVKALKAENEALKVKK